MLAPALRSVDADARRRARRPLDARRSVAAAGRSRPGGSGARPPARHAFATRSRRGRLSTLWRLHGRLASARGDQSRAIALHGRALKHAETAHDSRAIGLAHYELGQCYRQVGDIAIVREHITKAASALHAAGDRRHLALVHSLSGISLAQLGRYDEAMAALRQAERLASLVQADDVLATVCGNQANVTMLQHRYEQALALAERSVALHEAHRLGPRPRGRARHARTDLRPPRRSGARRRRAAPRARSPQPDSVPRDDRRRVRHAGADSPDPRPLRHAPSEYLGARQRGLRRLRPADQPVVRVVGARARRAARAAARRRSTKRSRAPTRSSQAGRPAVRRAAGDADRRRSADSRRTGSTRPSSGWPTAADALDPQSRAGGLGRIPAAARRAARRRPAAPPTRTTTSRRARRCSTCSASAIRPPSATSRSAGWSPRPARARSPSAISTRRSAIFAAARRRARSRRHRRRARAADQRPAPASTSSRRPTPTMRSCGGSWTRRRCRSARRAKPRRRCSKPPAADCAVVFVELAGGDVRVVASAGCDADAARALARAGVARQRATAAAPLVVEPLGRDHDGPRFGARRLAAADRPSGDAAPADDRRGRAAGIRAVRARATGRAPAADRAIERSLEPLLPGFLSASAAMNRVVEQIQRLQGNDLTVLITGESGTGKELVARAIHVGSHRSAAMFLPYNCTTTGRDLADSQLFGHRRGSFTGAVSDQPGLVRIGRRRHAVPRRDRRPAARRPAEAAAVPRAAARSCRSARRGRRRSTSACSRRPTPTSSSASPKASSARTSTTG